MRNILRAKPGKQDGFTVPFATKLVLTFLFVITFISVVFMVVGARLISNRIVAETQEKVRNDLNVAREIYLNTLDHVNDVVQFTAESFFVRDAFATGNITLAADELARIKTWEGLDILSVTDKYGYVLIRTSNPEMTGDNQGRDALVNTVLYRKDPIASTIIVSGDDLLKEGAYLAERAYFEFIGTPLARFRVETEETNGMMLKAAAPIFDSEGSLIGTVYGGILLNRNYEIVDKVKQTVYQDVVYKGRDIGTATIFQDDVRISTNVKNEEGSRAIGTRVSEEVYNRVILEGERWIGRAYVVNNWYITAYEPIQDVNGKILGILYVGVLEQKYSDIQRQTILLFLAITLAGALVSLLVSYFIAQRILVPISRLVSASKEVAQGNLDTQVTISTNDELQYLADSFNSMASALKKRDEQLKEFATKKIMESERLALIGQLAANVAHELNNPLQGIVTYSHLLLEKVSCEDPAKRSIEKIVGQANRCRDIIRGLLDFSRQKKPDKVTSDLNAVLRECISFVEHQALFHNIKIQEDLQENLPAVVVDPSQIERVFLNLIINAAEAMDGTGWLTLATRSLPGSDFVEIIFIDTGHGIKKENLDKIFDPFFTTKDVGHGTGLGLAISYGIVKGHGGAINVQSEDGKGATFIVRLPLRTEDKKESNGKQSEVIVHR